MSRLAMVVNSFIRLAVVVAATVLATGAVAHAEPQDDQFLGSLSNDGLSIGPPDRLIALAHERCNDEGLSRSDSYAIQFGGHPSPWRVAMSKIGNELEAMGFTNQQVRPFMQDAINVYCPGANNFG
ncbi:MAG TPA: DUF732 domain-containing protein [Mycobacterium sp.]|nr:DUF732 domain-containing protein [Mycobacterium sp.]